MAIVTNPLLKGLRGRVDDLIFYERDGKTCVRKAPGKMKKTKSPLQQNQRKKMKLVNDFLRPFIKMLTRTFVDEVSGKRPYNLAKSYNLKHGTSGFGDELIIDHENALLCKGPLLAAQEVTGYQEVGGVRIRWKHETGAAADGDTLLVMMRHKDQVWSDFLFSGAKRSHEEFFWQFERQIKVEDCLFWVAFTDRMGVIMSDSTFVEVV